MIRKLTYLIVVAASLLLTACGIYDDSKYGPNGEQKVKISFILALGSSDEPVTKADTWSPDGYGANVAIGSEFDNTILLNALQIVFYTTDNQYYTKLNIDSWEKVDPEGGQEVSNLYRFTGHAWVDEEYVVDQERKLKMMVFANIDEEVTFLTDIEEMTFKGVKKDRVLAVDNSKVHLDYRYGEQESGLKSSRIELRNITDYSSPTNTDDDCPISIADLHFTKRMKVRFTVAGSNMKAPSYEGRLLFADSDWNPNLNIDEITSSFAFTGDGTYEVECIIDEEAYHADHAANSAVGANVFLIDIVDTYTEETSPEDQVFVEGKTTVTIDEILLQDHQEYIPMWGVKTLSVSEMGATVDENERPVIYVLRAMSKVEVTLSDELVDEGYTLTSIRMENVNQTGYCLPLFDDVPDKTESLLLEEAFNPNPSALDYYTVSVSSPGEKSLMMYVPEYDNTSVPATISVVLQHNESGVITKVVPTQKIEFKQYAVQDTPRFNILRNHNYRFVITGVSGLEYSLTTIEDLELGGRYGFEFEL